MDTREALAKALSGDEGAFATLVSIHQRTLFRHCYRMLGSGPDAEDALQDTLLRAWRRLDTLDDADTFGGWLYRIATNVCLDELRSRPSRFEPTTIGPPSREGTVPGAPDLELRWVEPIRTEVTEDPLNQAIEREDISLAFVAALQRLAPRQRACLLLHDVLGFSQAEIAEALDITPPGVNSLLYRARQSARPRSDAPLLAQGDSRLLELMGRYVEAWRLADIGAFMELVADDIRLSMPPLRQWFSGASTVGAFVENAIFVRARPYGVSLQSGWCNSQPAFAIYEPGQDGSLLASGVQVLEFRQRHGEALITNIVSYRNPELAVRCGFPPSLP
jgi:RNA polymerase sigma-70 factor (ECF subfamily)